MSDTLHLWLNLAVLLVLAGMVAFCGCLSSTTFWGDE